jgi:hypothetical protein
MNNRMDLLERVKLQITESHKASPIRYEDLEVFEKILKEKKQKITDTSTGSIKIPFTEQPLEINLVFRLDH